MESVIKQEVPVRTPEQTRSTNVPLEPVQQQPPNRNTQNIASEFEMVEHLNNIMSTKIEDLAIKIAYNAHILTIQKRKLNEEISFKKHLKMRKRMLLERRTNGI
ncbi:uncharacterized protein LOC143051995 [Mytilus galloprovincialis]|uniref:uncharacterized protein LOC143051995 n=1 Tax=Mytilus galloprovincialis TaxID=29158 RepID=UPI003F7CBABB